MLKNQVVRLSNEADLTLANIKHTILQTTGKRVYKKQILNWLVISTPTLPDYEKRLSEWVASL